MCDPYVCPMCVRCGKKLHIELEGTELSRLIDRLGRRKVASLFLVADAQGQGLSSSQLRSRFDAARLAATEAAPSNELKARIKQFQFRDIRPRAATDINAARDTNDASKLLGHSKETITKMVYIRKGESVKPTK